jgi:hypothetical protein
MNKIFLLLVTVFFFAPAAYGVEETPELTDCARAEKLPKDAGADSRRIACNIPEDLQESVTLAQFFGGTIRMHDIAAWLTTDSLKEAGAFKENKIPGKMLGWLTFEKENLINIRYFVKKDEQVFVFAQADLDKLKVKAINNEVLPNLLPASEAELSMLRALDTAKSKELLNCTGPFNSVVLPFTNDNKKEIRVYLFSPWTDKSAPMGGHHLIRMSEDGQEIISQYSQTKGCINNDNSALRDKNMAALMISHLTSDTPTEMHVFMSLQYKKPIYVMTINNGITWSVEGKKISVLDRRDGKKPLAASTKRSEDGK